MKKALLLAVFLGTMLSLTQSQAQLTMTGVGPGSSGAGGGGGAACATGNQADLSDPCNLVWVGH